MSKFLLNTFCKAEVEELNKIALEKEEVLKATIEEAILEIKNKSSLIDILDDKNDTLLDEINALKNKNTSLIKKYDFSCLEIDELQNRDEDKEDTIKNLKKQSALLINTVASQEKAIDDYKEDIVKFLSIVANLEATISLGKEDNEKLNKEKESLQEALSEIANYDVDKQHRSYLLNDFFQLRAKKALDQG